MSNKADIKRVFKKKFEDLCRLQNQLEDILCCKDLDSQVQNYVSTEIPESITNSTIFSPLFIAWDETLEDLATEVEELQYSLRSQLSNSEDILEGAIQSRIAQLNIEIEKLKDQCSQEMNQMQSEYSNQNYSMSDLWDVQSKIQEERNQQQKFLENQKTCDHDILETEDLLKKLSSKSDELNQYYDLVDKQTLEMEPLIKKIANDYQRQLERKQELTTLIVNLEKESTRNKKTKDKLNDKFTEHQNMVNEYHKIEEDIKSQEQKQESALSKMVDAVELAEEANARAQKNRMTRDSYVEELGRIKELISTTTRKFEASFSEHQNNMIAHFEAALKALKERIITLTSENSQLSHDKSSSQKQLEIATQENAILRSSKADNGFSSFIESMAAKKSEIEAAYSKKEQYTLTIEVTQQNINEIKGKLITISNSSKEEQKHLQEVAQKLEMEVQMQKSLTKQILEKNATISSQNQKLRNDIIQNQRAASMNVQDKINEKDQMNTELQMTIDKTQKAHSQALSEMNQTILAYRQHAEKWKGKFQAVQIESQDDSEHANEKLQSYLDEISNLENIVKIQKQEQMKANLLLEQTEQQIRDIQEQISNEEKKKRQIISSMDKILRDQQAFSQTKRQTQDEIQTINIQKQRLQRKIKMLNANNA